MPYTHTLSAHSYHFDSLRTLLAKASPLRSGDQLAGVAAGDAQERVAAQMALADLPLSTFLNEAVVPYEVDEVTRLILDTHDAAAFAQAIILGKQDAKYGIKKIHCRRCGNAFCVSSISSKHPHTRHEGTT